MEPNSKITDDFLDDNWRNIEKKAVEETQNIIKAEFSSLKTELEHVLLKFESANYGPELQNKLEEIKGDSTAKLKSLLEHQQQTRQLLNELKVSIESINDEDIKKKFTNLSANISQTDEKLSGITTSVLSFSDKAGKVITNTLMKSVIGVIP